MHESERVIDRSIDVTVSGEVNHRGWTMVAENALEFGGGADVDMLEAVSPVMIDLGEVRGVGGPGECIDVDDPGIAVADQVPDERRPDEAGAA